MKTPQASPPHTTALRVESVMTPDPLTCHPDDRLLDAAARMQQHRIRHLPVVDGRGALLGMLSDRDVRNAIGDPGRWPEQSDTQLEELRVDGALNSPALFIQAGDSLADAIRFLVDLDVGALPVVDRSGLLVGIVSYVDVLRAFRDGTGPPTSPTAA